MTSVIVPHHRRPSALGDRRRPHHHRRRRLSRRRPALPEVRIGGAARARRLRVVRRGLRRSCRPGSTAAARRSASTASPARRAFVDIAAPFATGLHQVDNPVVRSRRQSVRDLQRHARPAGAGVDLPRAARTARARRSRRASSTRRRWRSIRDGRALRVEPVRGHGVPRRARRDVVEPFATDLGVACGLAFAPDGTLFVGDRSGTIFASTRRARDDRSRRCRRASRRFIWRSARTARCT